MQYIFVTIEVLKFDTSKDFSDEQYGNILLIFVTADVSKLLTFKVRNEEQF